jgi:hypothetical protein
MSKPPYKQAFAVQNGHVLQASVCGEFGVVLAW